MNTQDDVITDFLFIKIKNIWGYVKTEHYSFLMLCAYLFFEYTRPQSIFPVIDFLPWAQLLLVGSSVGAFFDRSVRFSFGFAGILITCFAIAIFISSVFAYFPDVSRKYFILFYSWYVVFFLVVWIVNTRRRFYIFLLIFIVCSAKISIGTSKVWVIRGFSFTGWGLMGPSGYFQNSGELSILMLTLFPLAYYMFKYLRDKPITKFEHVLALIFWVTPIMTILGASSRGAQLALAAQLIFIFRKSIYKPKALFGAAIVFSAIFYLLPEEQKMRFQTAGEDKTSQQRLLYWENGLEMIIKHPITGVGYFNFPNYYEINYPNDMLYEHAELPHNIFIQVGTDAGLLGLIPFISLCLYPLLSYRLLRRKLFEDKFLSSALAGISMGIFGFIIAGQFVTVAYYPFLWIGLGLFVSGKSLVKRDSGKK